MEILKLIGRNQELFGEDIINCEKELRYIIRNSNFLVIGGAGSIGQAVTKEIFYRNPKQLHVVDISENNLVELVRDVRSSLGYIDGDFKAFALDAGSFEFESFISANNQYDYILNLLALKHVRSEKDPYTLMRMVNVNIFNIDRTIALAIKNNTKKYFCVSTDKAANPVNMMGASKRIMEMFLVRRSREINISTARFANVAFSDGSLLHSFTQRIQKCQPIVAPSDIKRYFISPKESGELCLMSCLFGENLDIFFPKLSEKLHLIKFSDIALEYLEALGYEPYICSDEHEARNLIKTLPQQKKWPCLFTVSDTTGEKDFEEFFSAKEILDMDRFKNIGVIVSNSKIEEDKLFRFENKIKELREKKQWDRQQIIDLFNEVLPNFSHKETGKYLDSKM